MSVQDLIMRGATQNMPQLPQLLAQIAQFMQQQAVDTHRIAEALTTVTPTQPDAYASRALIVPTWQSTEQIIATGLLVSSDTTDFYALQIGNDTLGNPFGLTAMQPQMFNFSGQNRIPITRGLPVTVVQATAGGTAKIKAVLFYLSGPNPGRTSA